ncbi:ABC transporter permease [Pseudoruegeria sp. SK021]|uniref:ABC transporter permease n=1 Tax=Pseudoruegeria sp. SK021 TaxID=1933035 RepID=UPI000A2574AF|nr:ABC transporter permease [Pseudoruegeria sp. SK021]OSP54717.1 ABC transporter permease [Pseudoruegeria sp. SK021]
MFRFLIRRLAMAVIVLLIVSFTTFIVGHMTGDPVELIAPENATREAKEQLREYLGLNRPLLVQYTSYIGNALQGDLGFSFVQQAAVSDLIMERLPATLKLAFTGFILSLVIAVPLGIFIALNRNSVWDFLATSVAMIGQSAPNFWIGLMLIAFFAVHLKILPVSGYGGVSYIILPAITIALQSAARLTRLMRASMLEVLNADYVRTARSKGLRQRTVLWVHSFRNAMIPIVTMAGLELAELIGGAFITETIFAWPGVGRLAVNAVYQRDFPLVQGVVLFAATAFVVINLLVDLLYVLIDPRVKLS